MSYNELKSWMYISIVIISVAIFLVFFQQKRIIELKDTAVKQGFAKYDSNSGDFIWKQKDK